MTTFLFVRHALHALGGDRIAGRMGGVRLSVGGEAQAARLPERLDGISIDAVLSSPLDRAQGTAAVLAATRGLTVQPCDELTEIDFGEWTGALLADLRRDDRWRQWNAYRSGHRAPGGESMVDVEHRVVALLQRLVVEHPRGTIALVSHGDVIKAAVAHHLGVPLDLFQRIEISPASVSVVVIADLGPSVVCVNHTDRLADLPAFSGS